MTLNEWYRMHGLFLEAKMAFVVQEQIDALETDINNKNELIEDHEEESQLRGKSNSILQYSHALAMIRLLSNLIID